LKATVHCAPPLPENLMIVTAVVVTLVLVVAVSGAYAAVCTIVAHRFTTARRVKPPSSTGAATPSRDVSLASRGHHITLHGWYLPAACSGAAVVFVHGKDACRGSELRAPTFDLACAHVAAGISVLMIDLRGHGTSTQARMTYGAEEKLDVLGAVDWLRTQGHRRVGVLGASMGAASALLAAADDPTIDALVSDSAYAHFGTMIQRQFRHLSGLPSFFVPGALALCWWLTGQRLADVNPLAAAADLIGRPLLVVHSQGDRFVSVDDAVAIAGAAAAECWITDNDGHIGSFAAAPAAYTERVVSFFSEHLGHANFTGIAAR
jgi:uncharacterized protein